mgnify:FL=1
MTKKEENLSVKRLKENRWIQTARHYADSIWEYSLENEKIYIYYDSLAHRYDGSWCEADALTDYFKDTQLFHVDFAKWDEYLSKEALRNFCAGEEQSAEFQLRFRDQNGELQWHKVVIDRWSDTLLMISSVNIYNEIKDNALYRVAENVFENIVYIEEKTGEYVLHDRNPEISPVDCDFKYDIMIREFLKRNAVPDEVEVLYNNMRLANVKRALVNTDKYIIYITMVDKNGILSYKKLIFRYLDPEKEIITVAKIDVSDIIKEYDDQIKHFKKETYNDALTGVRNRKYFEEKIKKLKISAGVAIIDLDDFKLTNDTFGHSGGDLALTTLVHTIRAHIEPSDILVRYGGDEFVLILPEISEDHFEDRLHKIQNEVDLARVEGYQGLRISVSIGGVLADDETVEEAVLRADKLMYLAKNKKNMVVTEKTALAENGLSSDAAALSSLRQQVLIVDDSALNRAMLSQMLSGEFRILEAENGAECLKILQEYGTGISLVLLDIVMPKMDGFEVLAAMNRGHMIEDIPVVMISGADSDAYIQRAYGLGVADYISRPFDAKTVYQRVYNTIKLYSKQRRLIALLTRQAAEREKNNRMMVDVLSQIVEFRNGESGMHVLHINAITKLLLERLITKGEKYRLTWEDRALITTASALHDIGKIGISRKILNKPGKLTPQEFETMKTHTVIGENILKGLKLYTKEALIKTAMEISRWHHERYDGGGYPDGLRGDEIPISAQVVSLADVYDALISKRVYKEAFSHEKAMQMILDGECGTFNPILLQCLCEIQDELIKNMDDENN